MNATLPPERAAASQAPRVGWMRRLCGPLYFTGVFWYRAPGLSVRYLPDFVHDALVRFFGAWCVLLLGGVRRAVGRNLEVVVGPTGRLRTWLRVFRTLHVYGWCLTERSEQFQPGVEPIEPETEGKEVWDAILASPRGCVLVTAHVGTWEFGPRLVSKGSDKTVEVVREEELDSRSQAFLADVLARHAGPRYRTHFATDDPGLALRLRERLEAGALVALQGDRPRQGGRAHEAALFGRPVALPLGPAALARSADVPLVPVFVLRQGRRRNRIVFRPPIEVPSSGNRRADLGSAVERLAADIEAMIRREPHQWFCFADVFGGARP